MTAYLLLFLDPHVDHRAKFSQWRREIFSKWSEISPDTMYLDAAGTITDSDKYHHINLYTFNNFPPPSASQIEAQLQSHSPSTSLSAFHWQLYNSISEARQPFENTAATLVTVGMTIARDETSHRELNEWYSKEHIPALAAVPGWQASIRLQLSLLHNNPDKHAEYIALQPPYLAIHQWSEPNGLGGEAWKKAVFTPWSKRISELQTAPVQRRVWRVSS